MADIIELIRKDHDEIRTLFEQLDAAGPDERADVFRHIVSELARHEAAEQTIVHPVLDDVVGDPSTAASLTDQEQQAEEFLAGMEKLDPTSPDFEVRCRKLRQDVLEHARREEQNEHPRILEFVEADERQEMAERFQRIKQMAPTHPHPNAPKTPAAHKTLGPITGMFDRARDAVHKAMSSG